MASPRWPRRRLKGAMIYRVRGGPHGSLFQELQRLHHQRNAPACASRPEAARCGLLQLSAQAPAAVVHELQRPSPIPRPPEARSHAPGAALLGSMSPEGDQGCDTLLPNWRQESQSVLAQEVARQ